MLGGQCRCVIRAGIHLAAENAYDQIRPLREMAVNRPDTNAGLLGDLSNRSIHARGDEHGLGRLEQRVDVTSGVSAHPSIRGAMIALILLIVHPASLD
jgi:hypothetical protein